MEWWLPTHGGRGILRAATQEGLGFKRKKQILMDGSQPQTFRFNWFGMQPGHRNLLKLPCDLNVQPSLRTAV